MEPKFTHLHVHTHYSLLDGLSKIPNLVERAAELGMDSIAITDHGNLYGAIEFYQEAKKRDIKPIIGLECYVTAGDRHDKIPETEDKRYYHITLLAKNNTGYQNLIQISTKAHLEGFYYKPRADKALLREYAEGIIALSGCLGGEVSSCIARGDMAGAKRAIAEYKDIFGEENFYLEVQPADQKEQEVANAGLFQLAQETNTAAVATADSHYLRPEDSDAHDVLLAVQTGNKVTDEKRLSLKHLDLSIKSGADMAAAFPGHPEVIENTQKIAQSCDIQITLGENQLPHFDVPEGFTEGSYLRKLCIEGLAKRYGMDVSSVTNFEEGVSAQLSTDNEAHRKIAERLDYELSVIIPMGFAPYMLIVGDFVNWAKSNKIVVGPGRGSAAGSLVAYVVNITNIDPIQYNLLFERFLNPDRVSMPDIDLDFADVRRDEVLRYVSDKYGEDKVAQIITFGTMAARIAIRDVGRALDYPYSYCDRIAKLIPMFYSLDKAITEVEELKKLYKADNEAKRLLDTARRLEGVVRHASTHACGVVITKEPLTDSVPLQHSSSDENSVVTQYEMHAVEGLGLLKMDFLGLKNLTIIENTLNEIERRHGNRIDIDEIAHGDEETFALLQKGDTTGVFQLESGGMRRYLKELKPNVFEDIIAMVALYRPGPMDLIPDYIARKFGRQRIEYIHPKLEPILKNTYGVGVYQEQMMQIARDLAGFTLAQADTLRKAIGKKIKSLLDEQQEMLISGMVANGIDEKTAHAIWELFPPFARYGFNRSHAACYAQVAYQTAYLKTHYPTEFMAALLNAEAKNIDRLSLLIDEADDHGIKVLPPSINESGPVFSVASDNTIRFGLAAIKNVGSNVVAHIIEERNAGGEFTSLENFMERVIGREFNKKSLESLTKAGALDSLGERNRILENMDTLLHYAREHSATAASGQTSLFGDMVGAPVARLTLKEAPAAGEKDQLDWEKELLGFYVSGHPLRAYREKMVGCTPIISLMKYRYPSVRIAALVHSTKKIITKKGDPMLFFGIEDLSGKIEAIAFPKTFAAHQEILIEGKVLILEGKVDAKDGEPKFLCERVKEIV